MSIRRTTVPLLVLFLVVLLIASCARPPVLTVQVDPGLTQVWLDLLETHPLPAGVSLIDPEDRSMASGDDPKGVPAPDVPGPFITIERVPSPLLQHMMGETRTADDLDDGTTHIDISREYFAPSVPLWDRRTSVRAADLESADLPSKPEARDITVEPLQAIQLPRKAIAVDGLYPDDPEYPLWQTTRISLSLANLPRRTDEEILADIVSWFEDIPPTGSAPEIAWIGGVGDIMVQRGVTQLLDRTDGLTHVFSDVLPLMQRMDLLLGNLEGAVTTRWGALEKSYTFKFHPRVLSRLHEAGFDYLSLTNNHAFDYGLSGFTDTLENFAGSPVTTSGAGLDQDQAAQTAVFHIAGSPEVRILSVGAYPQENNGFSGARTTVAGPDRPGVLWMGTGNDAGYRFALESLTQGFSDDSFDIVMVHGGQEWATRPSRWQQERYRSIVDAGADLVLGSHSHVLQGMEAHDGALIAHSLGNFVFPGMYGTEFGEESLLLRVGIVGNQIRYVEPYPVRINHQLLALDATDVILERLLAETRRLNQQE